MIVDQSPDAFLKLKLNIRKGDKLLPLHDDGKIGPLVSVVGVGSDSGTPTGKTVIWCESEGKKQKGEPVYFFPNDFPFRVNPLRVNPILCHELFTLKRTLVTDFYILLKELN